MFLRGNLAKSHVHVEVAIEKALTNFEFLRTAWMTNPPYCMDNYPPHCMDD
jgi:hypothetical protein